MLTDLKNLIGRAVEHRMPFLETPVEVWEEVIAVNLTGPWLGCQEAARQMVKQGGPGRIISDMAPGAIETPRTIVTTSGL